MKDSKELVKTVLQEVIGNISNTNTLSVPFGFTAIDNFTRGFKPGQLIVVAGRPGMGAFAFTNSIVLNTAIKFNKAVAVFTFGLSAIMYIKRLVANVAKISRFDLIDNDLSKYDLFGLKDKLVGLSEAPLFVDDTPSLSIYDLKDKIVRLTSSNYIKLIVIQDLQSLTIQHSPKLSLLKERDLISKNLKEIAKKLDIAIIVNSQLPNSVENNRYKRPKLSNLREINTIDSYADLVTFLYRPEYYKIDTWDVDRKPTYDQAEVILAKNSNGCLTKFRLNYNLFYDSLSE